MTDPEGCFLFLKGKLNGVDCTLANIYSPNINPGRFLLGILSKLEGFKRGRAIIAGDFNICLEPDKDSTSCVRGTGGAWLNKLKKKLRHCQLVDTWRMQHPNTRDYSFYSPVHATYSRLDFFLVEHQYIEEVESTKIGSITFSDHAPVSLQCNLGKQKHHCNSWRLNENLLNDRDIDKRIKEELEFYFKTNIVGETPEDVVWEAHKVYIRGIIMKAGSEKKKKEGQR